MKFHWGIQRSKNWLAWSKLECEGSLPCHIQDWFYACCELSFPKAWWWDWEKQEKIVYGNHHLFEPALYASLILLWVGCWFFWTKTSSKCFCFNSSCWSCESSYRNSTVPCESWTQFWMWVRVDLLAMTVLSIEERSRVFSNSTKSLIEPWKQWLKAHFNK